MKRLDGSRSGFTLVELVVGLTIGGIGLTVGAGAVSILVDARASASERLHALSEAAADRRFLVDLLASAMSGKPGLPHPFQAMDGRVSGLADDEITFDVPHARPYFDAPGTARLFVDRSDDTAERGLVLEFLGETATEIRRIELVPEVVSLDAEYLPPDPAAETWLRGWISTIQLPAAARVHIRATEDDPAPLLGLPILVVMGSPG